MIVLLNKSNTIHIFVGKNTELIFYEQCVFLNKALCE